MNRTRPVRTSTTVIGLSIGVSWEYRLNDNAWDHYDCSSPTARPREELQEFPPESFWLALLHTRNISFPHVFCFVQFSLHIRRQVWNIAKFLWWWFEVLALMRLRSRIAIPWTTGEQIYVVKNCISLVDIVPEDITKVVNVNVAEVPDVPDVKVKVAEVGS